jgi:hypothetical protein
LGEPNELRREAAGDKDHHRNEEREQTRCRSVSDCKTPGMPSCCAKQVYSSSGVGPLPRRLDHFNDQLAQWLADWRWVGCRRDWRAGRSSHRPCDATAKPTHKGKRNKDGERQRDQRDEGKERETQCKKLVGAKLRHDHRYG